MKSIALFLIRFYQRVISPRKGFCCAYAAYTGHASCSTLGYRAIRRLGVWHGLLVLNGRLEKCGVAYRRYRPGPLQAQAGFLDCDCGGGDCDLPSAKTCNALGDCSTCDCSWDKSKRKQEDDQYVVIPSRSNVR